MGSLDTSQDEWKTELKIISNNTPVLFYRITHPVGKVDDGGSLFYPKTALPKYKREAMTAEDLGGNFGEIDETINNRNKFVPWVNPSTDTTKKNFFRFNNIASI